MRKVIFIFMLLALSTISITAQNKPDRNGNLVGYMTKSDLINLPSKGWFIDKNYKEYHPNKNVVQKIKKNLKGITVKAFFGTWCHDSKRVIPRFHKIMELAGFDFENNFQMIGVSRGKRAPRNLHEGHNLKRTPTIIFYKGGKK